MDGALDVFRGRVPPPRNVAAEATFVSRRATQRVDQTLDAIGRCIAEMVEHIDRLADADATRLRAMADTWRAGAHRWAKRAKALGPCAASVRRNASLALLAAAEIDQLLERRAAAEVSAPSGA